MIHYSEKVVLVMYSLPLFEDPLQPSKVALRDKLSKLAQDNIFFGTSSWKYEGWLGQIYTPERYFANGKFSRKRFESDCLREYCETFPVVCGDFSFYQFPTAEFWRKLFSNTLPTFRMAFKVPEDVTVCGFPSHPRYGPRAGSLNPNFLNPALLNSEFLHLLEPYSKQVALIIFEFGAFPSSTFATANDFLRALAPLVNALPASFRYAVEIRNPEFLTATYFEFLRERNVAHVYNSWTRMPSISDQLLLPGSCTADFTVARALLRPGRKYEEAVALFSPYREIQEPNHEVRDALRNLLLQSKKRAEPSFIFVNNRLEGNAPGTIEAVVADW